MVCFKVYMLLLAIAVVLVVGYPQTMEKEDEIEIPEESETGEVKIAGEGAKNHKFLFSGNSASKCKSSNGKDINGKFFSWLYPDCVEPLFDSKQGSLTISQEKPNMAFIPEGLKPLLPTEK